MEITGDPPPLWPQLTTVPRRRSPSPLFSPPVLIILLPIIALIILFFAVPPFLSITSQILRPIGVKKSWDSLNILLVLFAILCGVFARRNDDVDNNSNNNNNNVRNYNVNKYRPNDPVSHQQWFDQFSERKIYGDDINNVPPMINSSAATGVRRLKRSSSSYPDLRQEPLWENNNEERYRFFDDFEINKYRSSSSISTNYNDRVHELRSEFSQVSEEPKVIPVDTFVLRSFPSPPPPANSPAPSTPPPPPPPPPAARHKPRRTYQAVGHKERVMMGTPQNDRKSPEPVTPPPPPPPPPRRPPSPLVQVGNRSEQKFVKLERRKSNATREIKMVFASLRKRKKKQKAKDIHDDHQHDCPLHNSPHESPPYNYSSAIPPPSPAPPPPPPPPPPSVFQKYNLFRKGSKSKKIHSVPAPPPPPPPPAFSPSKRSSKQNTKTPPTPPPAPPPSFFSTKRSSKPPPAPPTPPRRRTTTTSMGRPPLPTKSNYYDENLNSGGQSPLIPMPPPPPPPPFKMPEFKFVFRGDFVKIRSSPSSRCSSPDLEEVDISSTKDDIETVSVMDGEDGVGNGINGNAGFPVSCPSPDVNAKAETFIARLRDGWKLEKINSIKEKQRIG
ncbi:hypothetical protein COLO4_18154 [Corchorus olitorius]|uniref:Hydroxyproline-rich glycoprotein family protein n=1 Tax=Corchorus olitorius TaxID=93759 RepID=A0A1R3JA53_9ROSI|nr:hypothetical protein COLO4_18154 [Corchorus olitorius]